MEKLWYTGHIFDMFRPIFGKKGNPMKKLLCSILLCALLLSFPASAKTFSDVPAVEWFYSYVTQLSEKGIVDGFEDGTFRPGGTVKYGEALKLILLAAGYPAQPGNEVHWAGGYLNFALQSGILPVGPGYDLESSITRLQVAQIAARAMGLRASFTENPFADCSDPEVLALYEAGIIEGMLVNDQICFAGEDHLLRSQISAIIWRMEDYTVGNSMIPEGGLFGQPEMPETPENPEEMPQWPQNQTGGLLGPGSGFVPEQPELPSEPVFPEIPMFPEYPVPETPVPETPSVQKPDIITYNNYNVDVLEDVPVFAYDSNNFYLENGRMQYAGTDVRLKHGIDVSAHQGEIDWQKVANDGVDYAIIRAAYRGYTAGSLNKDSTFDFNAEQASAAGLQVGAYIFSQAITVEEALEEADYLLEILAGKPIDGPVVFDWEVIGTKSARTYGLDTETLCAAANAFCRRIEQAGYTPMVYFNPYCGYVKYDLSQIMAYDFWFAQYSEQPDFYYNFQMWQYTSSGKVDGVDGNVDLDVWILPR